MRLMELAERNRFPLISLVDIPGAYPGVAAEQHGQGGMIARSQALMARLGVPIVACVIGEGGSGGAIATAVADRVLMQENAIYTVISPEGCAAILWRDAGEAKKAAAAFKPDAVHCLELGVIDGIVPEPEGGAHTDHDEAARLLGREPAGRVRGARTRTRGRAQAHAPSQIPFARRLRVSQQAQPVERKELHGGSGSFRAWTDTFSPQHPQPFPPTRERLRAGKPARRVDPPLGGEAFRKRRTRL